MTESEFDTLKSLIQGLLISAVLLGLSMWLFEDFFTWFADFIPYSLNLMY